MPDHAYMAFLDILGYKEALDADIKNGTQDFKERMVRAFRVFDQINQSRYAYQAISDSMFISCPERDAVREFLLILRNVFVSFLEEGLLIRGGVSFGQHFKNQNITYSPVLTKAYQLESQVAEFPRIMIDSNILEMFPSLLSDLLVLKSGNQWFLNIVTTESFERVWTAAKAAHDANLSVIQKSERVRIKYHWLQDLLLEIGTKLHIDPPKTQYLGVFDDIEDPSAPMLCPESANE
ncbi:MAG: hypothetical protein ABFD69_12300 [Candidatus Sumerlaeia bacterium]